MEHAFALGDIPLDLILWGIVGLTIIAFTAYSAILLWHWKTYSTGKYTTVANMLVYLGVSVSLISIMALSALWYSLS